jgi:hypothetical protein
MMDVPVLTAVIGVSGTLLGTIVGGCLTTFTNILLQKRREQAEFRVGCRLIAGELEDCETHISVVLDGKLWRQPEIAPQTKAWEAHQHVLASYLPYEAWRDVQTAMMALRFTCQLAANSRAVKKYTMTDEAQDLADYAEDLKKGQAVLLPYL